MYTDIVCKITERIYLGAYFKGISHALFVVAVILIANEIYKRTKKSSNITDRKIDRNTSKAIRKIKEEREIKKNNDTN